MPQARLFGFAACGGIYTHCREAAIYNPRAIGPSNLRTLRPKGPVKLKNLLPTAEPFEPARHRRAEPSEPGRIAAQFMHNFFRHS